MNYLKDIKINLISTTQDETSFLNERIEKITVAIYLVTDFIKDSDPLKFQIRKKSLELMSFIKSFCLLKKEISLKENIYSTISEIKFLLELSNFAKDISDMNYSILINEYKKIVNFLEGEKTSGDLVTLENLFKEDFRQVDEKNSVKDNSIENLKDIKKSKGHQISKKNLKDNNTNKNKMSFKKKETKRKTSTIKLDRKKQILNFIKDNKEVSIKDISRVIKTCSEKTIQRDLMNMMKEGVLKKEGKKRWSKYLIKK